jgi:hypothetical protein
LRASYRAGVFVATSPPTHVRVTAMLGEAGMHAGTPATNARGPLYRLALKRAVGSGAARVHYLDFDRALHWMERAPAELTALLLPRALVRPRARGGAASSRPLARPGRGDLR